jgi:DNA repair exonuclease SbcCD ATPase subunit
LEQEGVEEEQDTHEEPETKPEDLQKQIQELREQLDQANKERDQQRYTIDRQGNELGELRKIKSQIQERLKQKQQDDADYYDDPAKFRESIREENKLNDDLKQVEQREKQLQQQQEFQRRAHYLQQALPQDEFKENVDEITEILQEKNIDAGVVNQLKSNPMQFALQYPRPEEIVFLNMMAKERREKKQLQQELEEAKKKPKEFLDKIERTASSTLSNKRAGGKKERSVDASQLQKLSDEELERIIAGE